MKALFASVLLCSAVVSAAPPLAARPPPPSVQPAAQQNDQGSRREEREKKVRLMLVVGIAEALNLTEAEALKMGVRRVIFADARRESPIRMALAGHGTVISQE